MRGGDLSQPLAKPAGGAAGPHGMALSDDFGTLALGAKWNFFRPAADERSRARVADGALILTARGTAPVDSSPLLRSEEHTSELQSLMRISYAVFCLKKKTIKDKEE